MRRAALLVLLVSRVASGQSDELTKEYQAGIDAARMNRLDEAISHLEKARKLDPKLPGPYRWLAVVAQRQQRWRDCIDLAHKAVELNPKSTEGPETRKLHEECRVSAGRTGWRGPPLEDSGAIALTTNVSGATVKINGLTYGGTPLEPRPITAGPLEIEIEKPGWLPHKRTVVAPPGIVTDLEIDLEVDPDAKTAEQLDVEGKPIKVGYLVLPPSVGTILLNDKPIKNVGERIELPPGTHVLELESPGKDTWRRRIRISAGQKTVVNPELVDAGSREQTERTGFYILGAGGAVLAGGFVAAMMARSAADEARDIVRIERSRDPSRPLSDTIAVAPLRTREELRDARDRHDRWAVISNGLYAVGIVTAGVGAYFLYKGRRERRDVPPPFAIAPVRGGALVAKELSW